LPATSAEDVFIDVNNAGQRLTRQRDKDIPTLVYRLGGFGLVESDVWLTQRRSLREKLISMFVLPLEGVRFALSVLASRVTEVEDKLAAGQPLRVAAVCREPAREVLGPDTQVLRLTEGGLEALPALLPELDGTFGLVESGQTARDYGLVVVRDNLVPVTLDAVWPAAPQPVTIQDEEQ